MSMHLSAAQLERDLALRRDPVARMGMTEGQRNLLVRVVLRHPDRTLTDGEANDIRDRIYGAAHQGGAQEWST